MFIYDIPFDKFLILPIDDLLKLMKKHSLNGCKLYEILNEISEYGLGYLSLNRSIPSLSGGELQKLNFSKVCNSDITGILIVIDEISSQVHASDYSLLIDGIRKLKLRGNTIVLVENNENFIKVADHVINIGPLPGKHGGYLEEHLPNDLILPNLKSLSKSDFITIDNITKNNVNNINLRVPRNVVTVLVGKSGAGKSSIAKYISENISDTNYISQDLIKGNIRSTVATLTGFNKKIAKIYSQSFKLPESVFNVADSSPLICSTCQGKGVVRYARSFERDIEVTCPDCEGRLFSDKAQSYLWEEISIRDIYEYSFSQIVKLQESKLSLFAESAVSLGLGHLSLNRKSQTLSGGELKRIKLLISLPIKKCSEKILIIDEPASGLDNNTANSVMDFICDFAKKYKSIILIDHKLQVFLRADHIVEVGPESGIRGGKIIFEGSAKEYYENKYLYYIKNAF